MSAERAYPFELNPEAVANWLERLHLLPHAQAAHLLSQVFKQLKEESCHPPELLALLTTSTPSTLEFSKSLSITAVSEANQSNKAHKLAKLSMQLTRQLALIFCQLIESKKLNDSDSALAIYYAVQLIGYCLRDYCLFYQLPSATLWKKSALLYKWAAVNNVLTQPQTIELSDFKPLATIESVIKRNLLFSILAARMYKNDDINAFFRLASECSHLLDISTDKATIDFGYYWDLEKSTPPCPVKKNHTSLPSGFLAINTERVSQELYLGTATPELTPSTLNKLALALSAYRQVFSSIIPAPPSQSKMIVGFIAASHLLHELNKLLKINQLGSSLSGNTRRLEFSLVPLEHQRNVFDSVDSSFSNQAMEGKQVKLHKTPNQTYVVAERRSLDCEIGDIVLLYKEQHPVSLAIIRQHDFNEITNANQFLLEQIPGQCSIYALANTSTDAYAIIIGEDAKDPQVFLASGTYALDTAMPLTIGMSLILTACLESNSFYTRFRFIFEKQ